MKRASLLFSHNGSFFTNHKDIGVSFLKLVYITIFFLLFLFIIINCLLLEYNFCYLVAGASTVPLKETCGEILLSRRNTSFFCNFFRPPLTPGLITRRPFEFAKPPRTTPVRHPNQPLESIPIDMRRLFEYRSPMDDIPEINFRPWFDGLISFGSKAFNYFSSSLNFFSSSFSFSSISNNSASSNSSAKKILIDSINYFWAEGLDENNKKRYYICCNVFINGKLTNKIIAFPITHADHFFTTAGDLKQVTYVSDFDLEGNNKKQGLGGSVIRQISELDFVNGNYVKQNFKESVVILLQDLVIKKASFLTRTLNSDPDLLYFFDTFDKLFDSAQEFQDFLKTLTK